MVRLFCPFYLLVALTAACSGLPLSSPGTREEDFIALLHLRWAVLQDVAGRVYAHFISDNKDYGICLQHPTAGRIYNQWIRAFPSQAFGLTCSLLFCICKVHSKTGCSVLYFKKNQNKNSHSTTKHNTKVCDDGVKTSTDFIPLLYLYLTS